jgi:hypothetical protein
MALKDWSHQKFAAMLIGLIVLVSKLSRMEAGV